MPCATGYLGPQVWASLGASLQLSRGPEMWGISNRRSRPLLAPHGKERKDLAGS